MPLGRSIGSLMLLLALVGFVWGGWQSSTSLQTVAYAGIQTKTNLKFTEGLKLYYGQTSTEEVTLAQCPNAAGTTCVRLSQIGQVELFGKVGPLVGKQAVARFLVLPLWYLYLTVAATILFLIGLPMALFSGENAWISILSEKGGGLSLSRVQLMLWFGAALIAYISLSIKSGQFAPNVPPEIWGLLGLAGTTSFLSAGANPNELVLTPVQKALARETMEELSKLAGQQALTEDLAVVVNAAAAALKEEPDRKTEPPVVAEARRALAEAVRGRGATLEEVAAARMPEAGPVSPREAEAQLRWYQERLSAPVLRPDTRDQVILAQSFVNRKELDPDDTLRAVKAVRQAIDGLLRDLRSVQIPRAVEGRTRKLREEMGLIDSNGYRLSNMVEDWNGAGDLTRVQYLVLTVAAVGIFLMNFLSTASFPKVPLEFLELVGISQATYVGVKWMKKSATGAAR